MPSLFHIDFNLPKEYSEWIDDLLRFGTLLTVVHLFGMIAGKSKNSGDFFQNLLITLVGLTFYHLVVKKIVKVVDVSNNNEEGFTGTLRLFK